MRHRCASAGSAYAGAPTHGTRGAVPVRAEHLCCKGAGHERACVQAAGTASCGQCALGACAAH
eukprot:6933668-Alexandrium_andersonii.AAC.1